MTKPHALIVGSGIGGLTAALCLARIGWQITILERAPLLEEIGAGLQLSPNASRVLRDLGVLVRLDGVSLRPQAIRIRRGRDAKLLACLPLDNAERRWGAPYCMALRSDLQRALIEAVAAVPHIRLLTGTDVAGFAAKSDGVTVATKQGIMTATFDGDCLIGSDGVQSLVRKRLLSSHHKEPTYAGFEAWRALVPADRVAPELLHSEANLWLGPDAHAVHYPLRGGTLVNVAIIIGKKDAPKTKMDGWTNAGDPNFIATRFSKWHALPRCLIAAAQDWRTWPLYDLDPLAGCTAGRIALLGDAAHPMLPFLAQGAAQAIEDAAALGQALGHEASIEAGLSAYAAKRRDHTARVQKASRQQGVIYHLAGPAAFARDLAIQTLGPQRMLARNDWIYRDTLSS